MSSTATKQKPKQKPLANLRVCASCEWIYQLSDKLPEGSEFSQGSCPKCGFGSYGARYVYGPSAYKKALTQKPWMDKKLANLSHQLFSEIEKTNPIKPKTKFGVFPPMTWMTNNPVGFPAGSQ